MGNAVCEKVGERLPDPFGLDLVHGDLVNTTVAAAGGALNACAMDLEESLHDPIDFAVKGFELLEDCHRETRGVAPGDSLYSGCQDCNCRR